MSPLARMWGAITALAVGIGVSFLPQGNAEAKAGPQVDAPKATISDKPTSGQHANASEPTLNPSLHVQTSETNEGITVQTGDTLAASKAHRKVVGTQTTSSAAAK